MCGARTLVDGLRYFPWQFQSQYQLDTLFILTPLMEVDGYYLIVFIIHYKKGNKLRRVGCLLIVSLVEYKIMVCVNTCID